MNTIWIEEWRGNIVVPNDQVHAGLDVSGCGSQRRSEMSEKKVDFCDGTWKPGNRVWHRDKGWVEITQIMAHVILVGKDWYMPDGRNNAGSILPTIFPNKFELPDEAYKRHLEQPDLAVDTPLWGRDYDDRVWTPVHFAKWVGDLMFSWAHCRTSHTETATWAWKQWRLDDPAKKRK